VAIWEKILLLYYQNGNKSSFLTLLLPFYLYREQALQLLAEQALHALLPEEDGAPSELLENNESTR